MRIEGEQIEDLRVQEREGGDCRRGAKDQNILDLVEVQTERSSF